jgi:hypothetical protein
MKKKETKEEITFLFQRLVKVFVMRHDDGVLVTEPKRHHITMFLSQLVHDLVHRSSRCTEIGKITDNGKRHRSVFVS